MGKPVVHGRCIIPNVATGGRLASATSRREDCEELDRADPLARFRDRFELPDGLIYLDGNSLGALPKASREAVQRVVAEDWGGGLIRSWNSAGWVDSAVRIGDKIGRLLGAAAGEVVVSDNTSVNLYKALSAAVRAQGARGTILTDEGNFPTDLYVIDAIGEQLGRPVRRVARERLFEALDSSVAVFSATHVDYRSGHMLDLPMLTRRAHEAGAVVVWDLCHSAGAVPVNLGAAGVDLAVGCTYKFLNGGPGSPAYLYARKDLHPKLDNPVPGWFGHRDTFAFGPSYAPAEDAARFQTGTPVILALAALEASIDLWLEADVEEIRQKSVALAELLINRVEARCPDGGLTLASPMNADVRGSHVSLRHEHAYGVVQALAARGVIGDWRPPDLVRLGLTPLYTRYRDVWDAVESLADVITSREHLDPKFAIRARVP